MLYAKFTPEGIPGHIIDQPQDGYHPLPDGMSVERAAALMLVDGAWVARPLPSPPTPEELAAIAAAAQEAVDLANAEAEARREQEIARRAGPDMLLRSIGKITIAELSARVAAIRAEVEAGG
jgi:hypothetical protein